MVYMLCMNKLKDYKVWRKIFSAHKKAHIEAGLHLKNLWHSSENPNEIYFVFAVDDVKAAEAFLYDPANKHVGKEAGVIDGWIKYVEEIDLY